MKQFKVIKGLKSKLFPSYDSMYPFNKLKVGDGFIVSCTKEQKHNTQSKLSVAVVQASKKLKGSYITKRVENGVAALRVK